MKKIPNIQSIRQNFIGWEHDQQNLSNAAHEIAGIMKNQENYQELMNEVLDQVIKMRKVFKKYIK